MFILTVVVLPKGGTLLTLLMIGAMGKSEWNEVEKLGWRQFFGQVEEKACNRWRHQLVLPTTSGIRARTWRFLPAQG